MLLLSYDDRLTLAVPGRDFGANRVLDALARLALAVGATPDDFAALLRLGTRPFSVGSGACPRSRC